LRIIAGVVEQGQQENDPRTGAWIAAAAPRLFPRVPQSWVLYARALRLTSDETRILSLLKEAASRTNDASPVLHELVISYLGLDQVDDAREVLNHFKGDGGGWKHLSQALIQAEEHDWDSMTISLDEALQRTEREDLPNFQISGSILLASAPGEKESAIDLLSRGLEAKEDIFGRVMLGVLLRESAPKDAEANITKARGLWNGSEEAFSQYISRMGWQEPEF
jgi:hypothetical protein